MLRAWNLRRSKREKHFWVVATVTHRGESRRWSWGPNHGSGDRSPWGTESPRSWSIWKKYTTWNLRPCENARHNLMLLVSFFYCSAHRARGYFRYVLTVVCKYHQHFLGPNSIITHRDLCLVLCLLYQGILNWFYCLDSFVCFEFYSSIGVHWGPGEKPRQGTWRTESPRSWSIFKSTQPEI